MEEAAVKDLRVFGLLENEITVFLLLSKMGSSSADAIAKRLGTNRMSVYRTMETLQQKRLVESLVGRPSRFSALPIKDFLDRSIEDLKAKTSYLDRSKAEILDYVANIGMVEKSVEEPKFRIVQGRKHIYDQISSMLEGAKSEVSLVQTRNGLFRLIYSGVDDKLKKLHKKGAKIRILTEIDVAGIDAVKSYMEFAQVRHFPVSSMMRMVLVDEIEALTSLIREDSTSPATGTDMAMWIRAPDYVRSMKLSFDSLWNESAPAQRKLIAITAEKMFSDALGSVRGRLEAKGWIVSLEGNLVGESGVNHTFNLVAIRQDNGPLTVVVDTLTEPESSRILAFKLKTLDARPTIQLLAVTTPPKKEDLELAARFGAKIVYAGDAQQLERSIISEAERLSENARAPKK